jgi:hypothetical protein
MSDTPQQHTPDPDDPDDAAAGQGSPDAGTSPAETPPAAAVSSWPEPSAEDRRHWDIQNTLTNLITGQVRDQLGPDGVRSAPDPGYPGYGDRPQPDPLAAVRVARAIRGHAAVLLDRHIDRARAAGHSWAELAEVLGLTREAEREQIAPGEAAFHWATTGRIDGEPRSRVWGDEPRRWWRCASCQQRVSDRGPFAGHPDDEETGHAPDCARHTAELTAWRTRHDAWDDQ